MSAKIIKLISILDKWSTYNICIKIIDDVSSIEDKDKIQLVYIILINNLYNDDKNINWNNLIKYINNINKSNSIYYKGIDINKTFTYPDTTRIIEKIKKVPAQPIKDILYSTFTDNISFSFNFNMNHQLILYQVRSILYDLKCYKSIEIKDDIVNNENYTIFSENQTVSQAPKRKQFSRHTTESNIPPVAQEPKLGKPPNSRSQKSQQNFFGILPLNQIVSL